LAAPRAPGRGRRGRRNLVGIGDEYRTTYDDGAAVVTGYSIRLLGG
jgi:hypothetical protein